ESFNESEGCQEIMRDLKNLSIGYAQSSVFLIANSPFVYKDYNQLIYKRKTKFYPTATCLPFTKRIFLNVNGRVLPCENVDHEKSTLGKVGDHNINIDEENITKVYNNAYKGILETCKTCYRIDNCNYCFFAKGDERRDSISKCSGRYSYNDFAKFLSSRISNIENEPELYSLILKEEVLK
ncbi:MAG: SPASM domain-containing protein, partial [Bacteroidales bacterium]|nr:SPASM domain-containing protein [Bacteroidales bacterium]